MLFSKKIETKRDHFDEMKTALNAAIHTALKNGVPPLAIQEELEAHAADFRRMEERRIERLKYGTPLQHIVTEHGIKTVDPYEAQKRTEERRNAAELRRQQQEYRDAVNEAFEREKWTR